MLVNFKQITLLPCYTRLLFSILELLPAKINQELLFISSFSISLLHQCAGITCKYMPAPDHYPWARTSCCYWYVLAVVQPYLRNVEDACRNKKKLFFELKTIYLTSLWTDLCLQNHFPANTSVVVFDFDTNWHQAAYLRALWNYNLSLSDDFFW